MKDTMQFAVILLSVGFFFGYVFRLIIERIIFRGKTGILGQDALKEITAMVITISFGAATYVSITNPAYTLPWQLIVLMGAVLGLVWNIKDPLTFAKQLLPFPKISPTIEDDTRKDK